MAGGGRVYAGGCSDSNLTLLFQNPRAPPHSDALFLSGSSTSFLGSSSMVSFEDARGGKRSNGSFFCPYDQEENIDDDFDEYFSQPGKKRRLTADQVHFLERNFEVENKLEPDRKIQLAKDLGLQPRQVAIWFQNRRARWKTKQLEKDYDALQAAFNSLKTNYDSLLKEKENLRAEVILLKDKLQLKEEDRENPQLSDANIACQAPSQDPISESVSEGEESKVYIVDARQEVLSSAKSDVLDSESPHYTDGGRSSLLENADSSYVFEQDCSDLSQDEEDDFSKSLVPSVYVFPKLEDVNCSDPPANSSNTGFPVEDHAIWSWCF